MAEAVAEVLSRTIPNGVVIESMAIRSNEDDVGTAVGPLRVCGYLPADEQLGANRQRIEEGLWHLGQIQPLPAPEYRTIQETNWMEAWKRHYRPIPIGERLMVLPAWVDSPDPVRLPILIDPGMAFGTGAHPTTQLSLALLEKWTRPGEAAFDVGCGSAILAIAAARLGAKPVIGVDVDAQGIESARRNVTLNDLNDRITLGVGSVAELRNGDYGIKQAPVVVANILTNILVHLLDEGLAELLGPGGVLLLSGILRESEKEMLDGLERHGLAIRERRMMGDWVALAVGG